MVATSQAIQRETEAFESHVGEVSPELQEQLALEEQTLDAWMTFKVTPYLVEQIYRGESTNVNIAQVRDEAVIPEYERLVDVYTEEVAVIEETQVPDLEKRLENAEEEVASAVADLEKATEEKEKEYPSPRVVMSIPEHRKRFYRHKKDVDDLKTGIHNRRLKVQTNESMVETITQLLEDPKSEELYVAVDKFVHDAKKNALQEVKAALEMKRAALLSSGVLTKEETILADDFSLKIEKLNGEIAVLEHMSEQEMLELMENADVTPTQAISIDTAPVQTIPKIEDEFAPITFRIPSLKFRIPEIRRPQPSEPRRIRMLGGLSTALAWAGNAWYSK